MNKEIFPEKFSCSEFISYINSVISDYEIGKENEYVTIKKDIKILEDRIKDENLYLGVVGAFSSGKSTFINSVIHKNLLPTDAVQGTTVTASVLKKADFNDLEITYLDGTTKKFSQCGEELLEQYQVISESTKSVSVNDASLFFRLLNWIKRLLGISNIIKTSNLQTNEEINLFKKIIATEEIAKNVQYVTLYYQNDNIPYRIAMVDTPGTESLNQRHNDVTKYAINNICDAIVVIIPYDEPVSEDLLNYINSHLEKQKQECIFVVTKIELLGDRDELPRLIRVVKKRLENGLCIEDACVIPMPTFIYLKSVDPEMNTTFLDDIPESEKAEMIQMYEQGIQRINEILNTKRIDYIKNKVTSICERVSTKLSSNLSNIVIEYEKKNQQLQSEVVEPIHNFEIDAKTEIEKYADSLLQRINGEVGFINVRFSEFRSEIESTINGCNDSKDILYQLDFSTSPIFDDILRTVNKQLSGSIQEINLKVHDLQKIFEKEYKRCGARCMVSNIGVDSRSLYSKEFINECEKILQDRINFVKNSIRGDTNGLLKKVRAFFANSFDKHKELAMTELFEVVNELAQKVTKYSVNRIKEQIDRASCDSQNVIENMIESDRQVIESYIIRTNESLDDNNKRKESTQACITKLNEYISLM